MAGPMNISIPPLVEGQRLEDWKPLFVAATSTLVATSGERAAIQILPSLVCRDAFERATVLEAIKEETLAAAFETLEASIDTPIDEYEATARFRALVWARGVRVEVFFTQLWNEQLPEGVHAATKGWISNHSENPVTDKETREFLKLVQTTLRQKAIAADHGARMGGITENSRCAVVSQGETTGAECKDIDQPDLEVYRTYAPGNGQIRNSGRRWTRYRQVDTNCFTCGKKGHGYRACPERICDVCRKLGHDARYCTSKNPRGDRYRGKNRVSVVENTDRWDEKSATVTVKVNGKSVRALLDTGARVNVMDTETLHDLGLAEKLINRTGQVYGVCSTPVQVRGYVNVAIEVPGERANTEKIQVLEGGGQTLLLGRQFMQRFGRISFDWNQGIIELGDTQAPIQERATGGRPLDRARSINLVSDETENVKEAIDVLVNPELPQNERTRLTSLIEEYAEVFNEKPGRTDQCEHAIDTGVAVPLKSRPRRLPPRWEEEINEQLDELLNQKLCRPSGSPWASNVVLVTKKDGRKRFAIDYRRLNTVTKKDAYGIPQIQTILDKLHGHRYFSVLDIASAYWCVPVRDIDIEKTAFNTPRGLYEMTVMPFGLVNAQATFQRLMDNILLGTKNTESYIDDCIVYSQDFENHLSDLRCILERLRSANLHVKLRKCQFGREEVEFLGHLVSGKGRRPLPTAAERLAKFPRPESTTELQRFLGSLNFYRSYIPMLAQTAKPLYDLTRKSNPWKWSAVHENAYEELRTALTRHPVLLAHPDWNKEFIIEADASSQQWPPCFLNATITPVNYVPSITSRQH